MAEESLAVTRNRWVVDISSAIEVARSGHVEETRSPSLSKRATIFRVRKHMRRAKGPKGAHYYPDVMYLGLLYPSRFDHPIALEANQFRVNMVSAFLSVVTQSDPAFNWGRLCEEVVGNPKDVQKLYEFDVQFEGQYDRERLDETDEKSLDASVQSALTLDAVFLTAYLGAYYLKSSELFNFPAFRELIFEKSLHFHNLVINDIVKLENQVPLQLLLRVLEILYRDSNKAVEVLESLCLEMMQRFSSSLPGFVPGTSGYNFQDCPHLLACFSRVMRADTDELQDGRGPDSSPVARVLRLPSLAVGKTLLSFCSGKMGCFLRGRTDHQLRSRFERFSTVSLPTVVTLHEAGIHCKGYARGTNELVPTFKAGFLTASLYIPLFSLVNRTETLWQNMVAYDMETVSLSERGSDQFIYFLKFMDELINTEHDVFLLRHGRHPVIKKILLGTDKEVAELFNTIVQNCALLDTRAKRWTRLRTDIDKFLKQKYRRMVLEFMRTYLGKPWLVISLLAAIVLLVLTFLQTLYALLAFYR